MNTKTRLSAILTGHLLCACLLLSGCGNMDAPAASGSASPEKGSDKVSETAADTDSDNQEPSAATGNADASTESADSSTENADAALALSQDPSAAGAGADIVLSPSEANADSDPAADPAVPDSDADSGKSSGKSGSESGKSDPAGDPAAAAADPNPAGDLSKEKVSYSAPRMLDYIDAWDEWHTMEVDPSVRENPYDPDNFFFGEGDAQWTSYRGPALNSSESSSQDKTGQATESDGDGKNYECLQGVDVSEHQGAIDWNAVAEAGYRFAFIRVGYRGYGEAGNLYEDAAAVENLRNAKAAGLKVGAYFFSQALNEEEAAQEARVAAQVLEKAGVQLDLPLMYDPELIKDDWGRANDITREQVTLNTAAFQEEAQRLFDCEVDIYSNLPWEHNYFDADTMNRYDIWYADYEKLPQTPYHFTWWQYTNKGVVPGISGLVDLNLWIR